MLPFLLWPAGICAKTPAEFIWLSDLHFDPTATPQLVDDLAAADIGEWPQILSSKTPATLSPFAQDANWALFTSALNASRQSAPHAQFTIVTGDVLVHRFRAKFESAAKSHDEAAFRAFATKTMQFVAGQLETIAPGKPVFLTLGNNDSECGDYAVQPAGPFLKDQSASILKLLGPLAAAQTSTDWKTLGNYNVPNPSLKHHRIISFNSVYFSPRYQNTCATGDADPGKEEMQWLEAQLAEAKRHRNKVWLIFHIPPGVDGYATSHPRSGQPGQNTVLMWKAPYTEMFDRLLGQYRDTVEISLAGHEHMDDFRLLSSSLVLLAPGVSPVVGQNPAYRVVTFDAAGSLTGATTYYLSNLDSVADGTAPEWKPEYRYNQAWGLHHLRFDDFRKLYADVETKPEARERWSLLYSVSHPKGNNITKESFPWLFCATGNAKETSFQDCVKRVGAEPER